MTDADRMSRGTRAAVGVVHIFRPRVSYFACGLWAALTIVWLTLAARSSVGEVVRQAPSAAFLATVVYATCGRPTVIVRHRDVVLRNVLRDVTVPWGALAGIQTQYALTLKTVQGNKFVAWAAPAASRFSTTRATPSDLKTVQWDEADGPIPASASLRSDSGSAAAVVRTQWKRAQAECPAGLPIEVARVDWVTSVIALLVVTLVAAVVVALS